MLYTADDETLDPKEQSGYEDFMHTLNPRGCLLTNYL